MIGISINGEFLDLYPNTEVALRLISPVFSAEIEDNSFSLAFSAPGSPYNETLLGQYQNPLVHNSKTLYEDAVLWYHGIPYLAGNLIVQRSQGIIRTFSLKFELDNSSVSSVLKDTKIIDIDLGGQRDIAGSSTATVELTIAFTSYDMTAALQLNGHIYSVYWYNQLDHVGVLNAFANQINTDNANNHVDAVVTGSGASAQLELTASSGFSQVDVDINPIGNEYVWTIQSEVGQAIAIHDAMIDHMTSVATSAPGTYDYFFFPIHNPDFYDSQNPDFLEYVNLWDWDLQEFVKNTSTSGEQWQNTAVPFVRVAYLLNQICSHIGYTDISTFTQSDEFQRLCLYNNISLDQVRNDGVDDFNGFTSYIDIKNHIPEDMTCADLIRYIRDKFNLAFEVNSKNKTILFYKKNQIPKNTSKDWRDRSLAAYVGSRIPENERGYRFTYEEDDTDSFSQVYSAQYPDKVTGAGYKPVSDPYPPIAVYNRGYPGELNGWTIPAMRQTGKTIYPDVSDNGYMPRAAIYRGLQEGTSGKDYPYGSLGDLDNALNSVGNYSLTWGNEATHTATGILETFWNDWINGREEELTWEQRILLDLNELLSINYYSPYRLRTPDGEIDGVIRQIDVTLTNQGIRNSVISFLKL